MISDLHQLKLSTELPNQKGKIKAVSDLFATQGGAYEVWKSFLVTRKQEVHIINRDSGQLHPTSQPHKINFQQNFFSNHTPHTILGD